MRSDMTWLRVLYGVFLFGALLMPSEALAQGTKDAAENPASDGGLFGDDDPFGGGSDGGAGDLFGDDPASASKKAGDGLFADSDPFGEAVDNEVAKGTNPFGDMAGVATAGGEARLVQSSGELMIAWSKQHDSIQGFSTNTGRWTTLRIAKQKRIIPIVTDNVAAVRIGDSMAAYSGITGVWDTLKLSRNSKAQPVLDANVVTVRDDDYLYTFAAKSGKWTSPDDPNFVQAKPFSKQLLQDIRDVKLPKSKSRKAMQEAVRRMFDERLQSQKTQAARLREKLMQVETAIKKREESRDAIIERRVDQLLRKAE